jgi:hypothetical protein
MDANPAELFLRKPRAILVGLRQLRTSASSESRIADMISITAPILSQSNALKVRPVARVDMIAGCGKGAEVTQPGSAQNRKTTNTVRADTHGSLKVVLSVSGICVARIHEQPGSRSSSIRAP